MEDNKDWYYQLENGSSPFPLVRGPVSLKNVGLLIKEGVIRNDTLVRFGADSRWYAASNFLLLKRLLEPALSHAPSHWKKLPIYGLTAVILLLTVVYFSSGRHAVSKYSVLPFPERQTAPAADVPRLSVKGIVEYTNKARAENGGLPPLSQNSLLNTIACERADDMLQKQYFAHLSPSGEGAADVAQRTGYHYKHLGENIAMGYFQTDEKIVTAWMQSPGHRRSILSEDCSEIGVGLKRGSMKGEEVWVAVQIFGEQSPPVATESPTRRPATSASANSSNHPRKECQPPDESVPEAITKAKAELSDLTEQAASLYKEISADKSGRASGIDINQKGVRYNELVNEIDSRKQAARRMISDYNQSVERYNTCITN